MSQWWEAEAQKYLADALKFGHRQLCCFGNTNANTRYHRKVVGDSPEICRALDVHGFADLKVSMAYHISLISVYDKDDPRRFKTGKPEEMWSTMIRSWEMEPTSESIVQDIQKFPEVLRKIIAHRGCVVHDEYLRTGRRERSKDGKRILKHKPRFSQRKETMKMRPTHIDAIEARNMIISGAFEEKCRLQRLNKLVLQHDDEDVLDLSAKLNEDLCMALPYNSIVEC